MTALYVIAGVAMIFVGLVVLASVMVGARADRDDAAAAEMFRKRMDEDKQ